jgi:hypothetical protein
LEKTVYFPIFLNHQVLKLSIFFPREVLKESIFVNGEKRVTVSIVNKCARKCVGDQVVNSFPLKLPQFVSFLN